MHAITENLSSSMDRYLAVSFYVRFKILPEMPLFQRFASFSNRREDFKTRMGTNPKKETINTEL